MSVQVVSRLLPSPNIYVFGIFSWLPSPRSGQPSPSCWKFFKNHWFYLAQIQTSEASQNSTFFQILTHYTNYLPRFNYFFQQIMNAEPELDDLDASLICSVCLDLLFDPYVTVPCNHTFCETCLRRIGKKHALKKYDRFAPNTSCF